MRGSIRSDHTGGRLNLFFVEMIIVLLFFGIASAVILGTFAASGEISRESGRLERMSFCAQSAAEIFSETGSLSETAAKLFGIETEEADSLTVPLDENCIYSPADAALYMTLTVSDKDKSGLSELRTAFSVRNGEILYEIKSGAYLPGKDGVGNE